MTVRLGLDIGTNSVGSAWVDTDTQDIHIAAAVFPAGINEKNKPKGQERREHRSARRSLRRRAERKRHLRVVLADAGLLPTADCDHPTFRALMRADPWDLRRRALTQPLSPHEFGRVLVHLNQRRGWKAGLEHDTDDDKGKIKKAIRRLRKQMKEKDAETFGEFMAELHDERTRGLRSPKKEGATYREPIRNRMDSYEFHAERGLIREEFGRLWEEQSNMDSKLAPMLNETVHAAVANLIFFQRNTYWNMGSLGRCDLEPTDQKCPKADMYAQRYLMLETMNRIRIEGRADPTLTADERTALEAKLSRQKTASTKTVIKALKLPDSLAINLERERKPHLNTDWFSASIIHDVFGVEKWNSLNQRQRKSVNRAVQKFTDEAKLRRGAREWWGLRGDAVDRLIKAWKRRPTGRVQFSRRAIKNLLPHMEKGLSVTDAKEACGYPPHSYRLNKATRRFLEKHPDQLPPPPQLPNPVVRKAIHEVRRHVQTWIKRMGRKPDCIVVELARDARQPRIVRDQVLKANRKRERERKDIIRNILEPLNIPSSQSRKAIERVTLARRQRGVCAYSGLADAEGRCIDDNQAALGHDVEVDHIIPFSRSFDNSFNNKLLCFRGVNRDKGNRTPREWLSEAEFAQLELRLRHFKDEYKRAWENLHRATPQVDAFVASQLTDTGYITREVRAYLEQSLRDVEVLCTKGVYTAILRRDWGLLQEGKRKRDDHRSHAVDAVAIALTDRARLRGLAHAAQSQERARAKLGHWPRRKRLHPPWGDWDGFRAQVMTAKENLVVSHRPQRGVAGPLHDDTIHGKVSGYKDVFVVRVKANELTPAMLQPPEERTLPSGEKTLKVGKSGKVRDPGLRRHIRECLRDNGIHPERFTKKQIRDLVKQGNLTMPSGLPIKRVRVLRIHSDAVRIESDPRHPRYYKPDANHHMEIAEDKKGRWHGLRIRMFDAARNIRPPKGHPKLPLFYGPSLARLKKQGTLPPPVAEFYRDKAYVMSLCKGEMLCMTDPHSDETGCYFVVKKIRSDRVQLVGHSDARPSKGANHRRLIPASPNRLKKLHARKVIVGPLGDVRWAGD